mmetsp:Transcript_57935/g.92059  ORF Transcript_57935/g.92059 Transcript_57935/m.92059 type:complete len:82 (-) Transcript_57935:156-401(-)
MYQSSKDNGYVSCLRSCHNSSMRIFLCFFGLSLMFSSCLASGVPLTREQMGETPLNRHLVCMFAPWRAGTLLGVRRLPETD